MKEIPLTQGKVALVDDADYEVVMQFKWHANQGSSDSWYAARKIKQSDGTWKYQGLHQFLIPGVYMVDHIDGNGLNNQRYNLRPCTRSQNNANRKASGKSRFLGVSWNLCSRKWVAQINFKGKKFNLGLFISEEDAARAYDAAAKKFHKEFARPNFPCKS